MNARPVYLKLGGALLTHKERRESVRRDVLEELAREIAAWRAQDDRPLVLAHGSGSFAHVAARSTGFLECPSDRLALAIVAASARRLNGIVVDALVEAGLPALPVPGSLLAFCRGGRVVDVRGSLVIGLLGDGLLPVLYGDACPDGAHGGAIASTEPILAGLSRHLPPRRIVLATDVDGVFDADPHRDPGAVPWPDITPDRWPAIRASIGGARPDTVDVTGGMATKVGTLLELVRRDPALEARIVSGLRRGAVRAALAGAPDAGGTRIRHAR